MGAFIGGLYLGFSGGFKRAGYALLISNVLTAGCAIVFALITGIYFGFAFAFLFGLMNSIHIGLSTISMQMAITENVRGRLAGLYELAWGGFPAGGFMFGALADGLGPSASLIIGCGFVLLVTGAIGALNPQLRRLRMRV